VQPPARTALNNAFRAAYADARSRVLASSGPTLIVNGDNFTLLREGRRVEANVAAPIYDPVKTIAHIPLAIYVTLTPGGGAVGDDRLKTLAGLRELIPSAEASLDTLKLSAATLAPPEADRGRVPGFPRRCGRQAQVRAFRAAGIHPRHGSARHGKCHRGHPRPVGGHARPGLGLAPRPTRPSVSPERPAISTETAWSM